MADLIRDNIGPILLGVIVGFPLVQLVAALLLRTTRRKLLAAIDGVLSDGPLGPADKAWLRNEIDTSSGTHLLIASFFAPFAILGAVALGFYDGFYAKKKPPLSHAKLADRIDVISAELEESRQSIETMEAKGILLAQGVDPREGKLWADPRRREISELVHVVETWNHPIATVWIILWLVIAAPFILVGYAISGTIAPFLSNLWEPLRTLIVGLLGPSAHRAQA